MSEYIDAYNALMPPEMLEAITGPEETGEIHAKTIDFFEGIRTALGFQALRYDHLFALQNLQTSKDFGSYPVHDTELYTYRFGGYQTLGTVFDERDDFNFHVVTFFKHPLRPGVVDVIDNLHEKLDHLDAKK